MWCHAYCECPVLSTVSLMDYWVLIAIMNMRPARQSRYFQYQFRDPYLPLSCQSVRYRVRWDCSNRGNPNHISSVHFLSNLVKLSYLSIWCSMHPRLYVGNVYYITCAYCTPFLFFSFPGPTEDFFVVILDTEIWDWPHGSTQNAHHVKTNNHTYGWVCNWISERLFTRWYVACTRTNESKGCNGCHYLQVTEQIRSWKLN